MDANVKVRACCDGESVRQTESDVNTCCTYLSRNLYIFFTNFSRTDTRIFFRTEGSREFTRRGERFLASRGMTVGRAEGLGAQIENSGRRVIICPVRRVRLVVQDAALSRLRSRVRPPYAAPAKRLIELYSMRRFFVRHRRGIDAAWFG